MSKDEFAVSRRTSDPHTAHPINRSSSVSPSNEDSLELHPLSVLAIASSVRLDDPRLEQERIVQLGVAISAGRDAARALETWLVQSLAEYRGSRTAWDLEATTVSLRLAFRRYDQTLRETSARLSQLMPDLAEKIPGFAPAVGSARPGRHTLEEIAAASRILTAVQSVTSERTGSGAG